METLYIGIHHYSRYFNFKFFLGCFYAFPYLGRKSWIILTLEEHLTSEENFGEFSQNLKYQCDLKVV